MKLGAGAALTLAVGCLESCSSSTAPTEIDFTIDLNQDQFKSLNTNGSYLIYNGVVISKGIDGAFYAATVICSHENEKKVLYDKSKNQYICSAHGATFDLTGKGTNKNGSSGLTIYKTLLNGTILRVYY